MIRDKNKLLNDYIIKKEQLIMKKFFRNETNVAFAEAILLGLCAIVEIGHLITKWIDYRKEKKFNK